MVPPCRDKAKVLNAFFALIFTNKVSQACMLSDSVWGELPALDMSQVKNYLWEIGPYKSRGLDGLYPEMLRKWVIQYLFTVFYKDNLHQKVSRMIGDAYVHVEVYIHLYVHTEVSIYRIMSVTLQIESTF